MEIIIIILLTVLNGVFAMSEIALVSSRKSRLEQKAQKGSKGAKIALRLLERPEHFLSTVQVGITLIGIVAGVYGGVALAEDLTPYVEKVSWLKEYAGQIALVIVVGIITYLSLIIGELVPKSIAMNNPEAITIALAPFMKGLAIVAYPVVAFLGFSTKIVLKLFMIKERSEPPVTEEELKYLIEKGSQHGVLEKQESDIMKSVFSFGEHRAYTIMRLKKDITWLDINKSKEENLKKIFNSAFTKFPLCDGGIDHIIGTIYTKDLMKQMENGSDFSLKDIAVKPLFFPKNTMALKVLDSFRKERIHIGYVVNEYGGTEGLLTLHDLIENIMGDLPDFGDIDEPLIFRRADGSLLIDGEMPINELKRVLEIVQLPGESSHNYKSLGGLVINQLHRIPKVGDTFILDKLHFEIIDMDGNAVDKVLVKKI